MGPEKETMLRIEITGLLNRYSMETGSNTPDFILAKYLLGCLEALDWAIVSRDRWYSISPRPGSASYSSEPKALEQIARKP